MLKGKYNMSNLTWEVHNLGVSHSREGPDDSFWIHPRFGFYYNRNFHDASTQWYMKFTDVRGVNNIYDRMEKSYEGFKNGGDPNWVNKELLSIKPAQWFILYTSATPVSAEGRTDSLKTRSYDLVEEMWVSKQQLENKKIYGYLDPNNIEELEFRLSKDSTRTEKIHIYTDEKWVTSVDVLDGFTITSSKTNVQDLQVNEGLIVQWEDGKYYELRVSSSGVDTVEYDGN